MKHKYKILSSTAILLICLLSYSVQAQQLSDTLKYDILIDSKIVGDLVAVKNINSDSSCEYIVISNVDYKLLFSFHISFDYKTIFNQKGDFNSSKFEYIMNDDVKESNWVNCNSKDCYVYEDAEVIEVFDNSVDLTAIQLYFQEPIFGEHVFSERFCKNFDIKRENSGYKIDFPGGSTNTYYYKDGICYRIAIETLFSDMEIKMRDYNTLLSEK